MSELLPCPFCEASPKTQEVFGSEESGERFGYFAIECPNCNGVNSKPFCGIHGDIMEEAVAAWNTRAPQAINAQMLEALKELRLLVDGEGGMPEGVRGRADAAIAAATGDTK